MIIEFTRRQFDRLSALQRSVLSAFAALAGYGFWAYLVNSMHGPEAAFKAACVQGGYSFVLTFVVTLLIEAFFRSLNSAFDNPKVNQTATFVLVCTILFSTSWWINAMAGTPEIFSTVILGYVIGAVYTGTYIKGLAGGLRYAA